MPRKENAQGHIKCSRCKQWLPKTDFYPGPPSQRSDFAQNCKTCHATHCYEATQKRAMKKMGLSAYAELIKEDEHRLQIKKALLMSALEDSCKSK